MSENMRSRGQAGMVSGAVGRGGWLFKKRVSRVWLLRGVEKPKAGLPACPG